MLTPTFGKRWLGAMIKCGKLRLDNAEARPHAGRPAEEVCPNVLKLTAVLR